MEPNERIFHELTHIKITLAVNTSQLTEHMKRTEASENRLDVLESLVYEAKGAYRLWTFVTGFVGFVVTAITVWNAIRGGK